MNEDLFKALYKRILSDFIKAIPKGAMLYVYRGVDDGDQEFYDIFCDGWRYRLHRDGSEELLRPEGQKNED